MKVTSKLLHETVTKDKILMQIRKDKREVGKMITESKRLLKRAEILENRCGSRWAKRCKEIEKELRKNA